MLKEAANRMLDPESYLHLQFKDQVPTSFLPGRGHVCVGEQHSNLIPSVTGQPGTGHTPSTC